MQPINNIPTELLTLNPQNLTPLNPLAQSWLKEYSPPPRTLQPPCHWLSLLLMAPTNPLPSTTYILTLFNPSPTLPCNTTSIVRHRQKPLSNTVVEIPTLSHHLSRNSLATITTRCHSHSACNFFSNSLPPPTSFAHRWPSLHSICYVLRCIHLPLHPSLHVWTMISTFGCI